MPRIALSLSLILLPFVAAAHPGHGQDASGQGLVHYLTAPEHALVALALIASVGVGALLHARSRRAHPIRLRRR